MELSNALGHFRRKNECMSNVLECRASLLIRLGKATRLGRDYVSIKEDQQQGESRFRNHVVYGSARNQTFR